MNNHMNDHHRSSPGWDPRAEVRRMDERLGRQEAQRAIIRMSPVSGILVLLWHAAMVELSIWSAAFRWPKRHERKRKP